MRVARNADSGTFQSLVYVAWPEPPHQRPDLLDWGIPSDHGRRGFAEDGATVSHHGDLAPGLVTDVTEASGEPAQFRRPPRGQDGDIDGAADQGSGEDTEASTDGPVQPVLDGWASQAGPAIIVAPARNLPSDGMRRSAPLPLIFRRSWKIRW